MGLFGRNDKDDKAGAGRARLTAPEVLRRKGVAAHALIVELESRPGPGGTMADPAYHCSFTLEVRLDGEPPYRTRIQQRMARSGVEQLTGDGVVAPVWVDRKDHSRVAIDLLAGPVQRAPQA